MTLAELNQILALTEYPVAYSHWVSTDKVKVPDPPYILFYVEGSDNFFADNLAYVKGSNVIVELYTSIKDLATEEKLEELLDAHSISYESVETWIDSEKLFLKSYEMGLV